MTKRTKSIGKAESVQKIVISETEKYANLHKKIYAANKTDTSYIKELSSMDLLDLKVSVPK